MEAALDPDEFWWCQLPIHANSFGTIAWLIKDTDLLLLSVGDTKATICQGNGNSWCDLWYQAPLLSQWTRCSMPLGPVSENGWFPTKNRAIVQESGLRHGCFLAHGQRNYGIHDSTGGLADGIFLANPHHFLALRARAARGAAAGPPECQFHFNSRWKGSALGATVEPPGPWLEPQATLFLSNI